LGGGEAALLDDIVASVKNHQGLRRKADIGLLSDIIAKNGAGVIAAKGEDGAVLSIDGCNIVFAADGIMEELADSDPEWAGYCSILVNVHDILAMGGRPVAAVNVISAKDERTISSIVRGMKCACEKFDVKMVGGHLHPKASHNSISVAMMGMIRSGKPVLSTTARRGDSVIVICDCRGEFTPGIPYSWDCTSKRTKKDITDMMDKLISALSNLTSAKDISNPGTIGTLAMLLESSKVGAEISVDDIALPSGTELMQWLTAYQGFGFIGTSQEKALKKISAALEGTGLSVSIIGKITKKRELRVKLGSAERVVFDFTKDSITGLFD
jgi:selenophosphate synthetase-related protein